MLILHTGYYLITCFTSSYASSVWRAHRVITETNYWLQVRIVTLAVFASYLLVVDSMYPYFQYIRYRFSFFFFWAMSVREHN